MIAPSPRVVAFVNGELGRHAVSLVRSHLVAIVINVGCDYRHGPLLEKPWENAWMYADDPHLNDKLAELCPTHGVSAGFRTILKPQTLNLFASGVANVHTSLLPFGRGAHPNAWTIFLDQPAGVTLHLLDAGVDTGPIIAQREVPYEGFDTAKSLQEKLILAAKVLMAEMIPPWLSGNAPAYPQRPCAWPVNRKGDLEDIKIDGDAKHHGWEFVNILRARTYPPYPGALYTAPNGKQYRVRIEMEPA